jgi:N-carbamoylputrescine amidase
MKVTVCQFHNGGGRFAADWDLLVAHVKAEGSQLVLLPEMPFYSWFPTPRDFDAGVWQAAVDAHNAWERRLSDLAPAIALGTRPIDFGNVRYNAGFMWNEDESITETIHVKCCLTAQDRAWETSWYERGVPDFELATVAHARVGMLIGLELWMPEQARVYGEDGAQIIAVPRADRLPDDDLEGVNEWLDGVTAAAKAAGTYCFSSSRGTRGTATGGPGWVISPQGEVLATTSNDEPFVSVEIDLESLPRGLRVPSLKSVPVP